MTETEARQFLNDILRQLWPDWPPTDMQAGLWVKKLRRYNFQKAKNAISDWIAEQDFQPKSPPIGKVLKALESRGATEKLKPEDCEPVCVYELFRQDNPQNCKGFFLGTIKALPASSQVIEAEAERMRTNFGQAYGGNWVVNRKWERYYN